MRGRERERAEDELMPCPAVGCQAQRRRTQLVCGEDYRHLRPGERDRLDAAWRAYKQDRNPATVSALRGLQAELLGLINMRIGLAAAKDVRLPGARPLRRRAVRA